ncbi:hypothetical protein [Paenarthrobacter sp. YIM B13468]|uniref:hypothetical protein n=1 Tax=Paenarthrobacter sp. YIM B13468 TaxID=3366295 RepID=UPI0036734F60
MPNTATTPKVSYPRTAVEDLLGRYAEVFSASVHTGVDGNPTVCNGGRRLQTQNITGQRESQNVVLTTGTHHVPIMAAELSKEVQPAPHSR